MGNARPNPYCKGCIHCTDIGGTWGCTYIFDVGHKRPCGPGIECTVKKKRTRKRRKKVSVENA